MKLQHLSITDYRIFKGVQQISFPETMIPTVFVGVNGAGKTTIIEAIIGSLWEFYHQIQAKELEEDYRFGKSNVNLTADEFAKVRLEWKCGSTIQETGFDIRKTIAPEFKLTGTETLNELIETLKGDVGFYKKEAHIPIVVYYPVERTVMNPSLQNNVNESGNQFDAFEHAFNKSVNFDHFFEWFRSTEDLENEIRLNQDQSYSNIGLSAVRKAILIFLEKFSKIRVRRTPTTSLILEKQVFEDEVKVFEYEVNQLSHGEKALIAMVGDLARRLVIANPGLPKPLNGKGVVLIDEIDLHLHPKWQKTILQKLTTTFPNIQFICTTHSPLVINHLDKSSIFLLEDGHCTPLKQKYPDFNSYGADVEDILHLVQGTEQLIPEKIEAQFQTLNQLIQQNKLEEAKQLIVQLKITTDPNQSKLKRAETDITYKELL